MYENFLGTHYRWWWWWKGCKNSFLNLWKHIFVSLQWEMHVGVSKILLEFFVIILFPKILQKCCFVFNLPEIRLILCINCFYFVLLKLSKTKLYNLRENPQKYLLNFENILQWELENIKQSFYLHLSAPITFWDLYLYFSVFTEFLFKCIVLFWVIAFGRWHCLHTWMLM